MVFVNEGFARMPKNYLFRDAGEKVKFLRAKLEAEGKKDDIVRIGIGDPDIPTPAPISEEISRQRKIYRGYPDYDGIPELREAISEYYKTRFGVDMPASNIIIGDGAKSDLSHMPFAFSGLEGRVIMQDPAYPVYLNWSKFMNLDVEFINCTSDNNFFGDISENSAEFGADLIFLCNPNNPTGSVASKSYLERILSIAHGKMGAVVVHDIAYTDFKPGMDAPTAPSIFNVPGGEKVGIEIGSFSKPFSMTGDRLSWVAMLNTDLLNAWKQMRSNFDSGVPEYIQKGGVVALRDPGVKDIVKANMIEYGRRAEVLRKGFEAIGGKVYGIDHSPYCWVKIPEGYKSEQFTDRVLEEAHVALLWGSGFGTCGEGYARATVFQSKDKIEQAMERIGKIKW